MEFLGELPGQLTAFLYTWRLAIGAAMLAGAVVLILVARRRGWHLAARRHPGRTLAAGLLALVVAIPAGWYLASPLFIRTQLVEPEPSPLAAASSSPAVSTTPTAQSGSPVPNPSGAPSQQPTPKPEPSVAPTPTAFAPRTLSTGTFSGVDTFHFGMGTASLIETAPGSLTLRFEAFSVRNGPDLYVYISPDAKGYAKGALEVGRLKATDGAFNYALPAGLDLGSARSVIIWCKQFSALFAVAPLGSS